ncbi:MAG TPA: glycosyltransferase family 2 protein [Bacteroidia bacterium]|nr:glycosyltransferase family 2 protein [Bacteroidia bacterium]
MKIADNIDIVLSVYNGERYLSQQLESLLHQDHQNWQLIIRDDGSKDGSVNLINKFIRENPGKAQLVQDQLGNIGYSASFIELLKHSTANYIMFCDQDDVWYPNKISTLLQYIKQEEERHPAKPLLVFSNMHVINDKMEIIGTLKKQFRLRQDISLQSFFLRNYIPGCGMLFNGQLLKDTIKTKNVIGYFDYWLILVCCAIGKVTYVDEPLMKYRLHENNAIGLQLKPTQFSKRVLQLVKTCLKYCFNNKDYRRIMYLKNIEQIQNICQYFPSVASIEAKEFADVDSSNYFSRKFKNITSPYIHEHHFAEQLTYIICF